MADEQLPEGTDSIIGEDAGKDVPVDTGFASTINSGAGAKRGDAPANDGASVGQAGAWFDKIEGLKAQGYDSAKAYAVSGKDRATGALDELIRTVSDAAGQIDAKIGSQYGDYARRAAEGLGSFNDSLKGKDVDDLFADARAMVARAPAVAVGTAAALGFVIARLARAGLPETDDEPVKPAAKSGPAA